MSTVNDLINNQPTPIINNNIISAKNVSKNSNLSHLTQALNNLLSIVEKQINVSDIGVISYDHDTSITHNNNSSKPTTNTIINSDEILMKKNLINSLGNDCICYADCTQFAKWKYTTCQCNTDCGCNYYNINYTIG